MSGLAAPRRPKLPMSSCASMCIVPQFCLCPNVTVASLLSFKASSSDKWHCCETAKNRKIGQNASSGEAWDMKNSRILTDLAVMSMASPPRVEELQTTHSSPLPRYASRELIQSLSSDPSRRIPSPRFWRHWARVNFAMAMAINVVIIHQQCVWYTWNDFKNICLRIIIHCFMQI